MGIENEPTSEDRTVIKAFDQAAKAIADLSEEEKRRVISALGHLFGAYSA